MLITTRYRLPHAWHSWRITGRRGLTLIVGVAAAIAAYLTFPAPVNAQSGLAHAYRIIAGKRFIELTQSFGPDSPVWSGFG
jgi:hypothetical protein